jgi:inorganic triphosphatase YgiF
MKRQAKIARGYRLYPKTLKMIEKIQKMLQSDSDRAISTACNHFLKQYSGLKEKTLPETGL